MTTLRMAFKFYWMSFDLLHIATYIFLYNVFLDMFFCSFCFAHFAKVCSCYSLLLLSSSHFLIQHCVKKIFCSSLQEPEMNEYQKKRLTIEEVSCRMWGSCKTKTLNCTYSIMSSLLLVPDACTCVCLTALSELIGHLLL